MQRCEGVITEEKLLKALKQMPNNKLPGNEGITKEFYEAFWDDLKTPLLLRVKGYLYYKTITSQNVSPEAQIKNFFIS